MSLGDKFEAVVLGEMADAYATSFWVAFGLSVVTVVFSLLLPRKAAAVPESGEKAATPVLMH